MASLHESIKFVSYTIEIPIIPGKLPEDIKTIRVIGDFGSWNGWLNMKKSEDGSKYYADVSVRPNTTIKYNFLINGNPWIPTDEEDLDMGVTDPSGRAMIVKKVLDTDDSSLKSKVSETDMTEQKCTGVVEEPEEEEEEVIEKEVVLEKKEVEKQEEEEEPTTETSNVVIDTGIFDRPILIQNVEVKVENEETPAVLVSVPESTERVIIDTGIFDRPILIQKVETESSAPEQKVTRVVIDTGIFDRPILIQNNETETPAPESKTEKKTEKKEKKQKKSCKY